MKPIVALLFILGCGWALLAWMVVLLPIGIFMPVYQYQAHDIAFSLIGSFLAVIGYWIWFGWCFRWKTGRYPLVCPRTFWIISFAAHSLWAIAIPFGYEETIAEFWSHGDTLPFRSWIVLNIAIAVTGVFFDSVGDSRCNQRAQQDADDQLPARAESKAR